jgi:hypothetical protein
MDSIPRTLIRPPVLSLSQDDFEVSMFLTDSSTRHQLLTKNKEFTSSKRKGTLKGWLGPGEASKDKPVATAANDGIREVVIIREESPSDDVDLADIPSAQGSGDEEEEAVDNEREVPKTSHRTAQDDKKLAPRTTYDGFSIYGRVLCLVIKRRGVAATTAATGKHASSQQMMENWVSTQAANGELGGG